MKKIIKRINAFFQELFQDLFSFVKHNSIVAVKVTSELKRFVESPISDFVVTLIPTDVDNVVLERIRKVIPEVAAKVAIFHGIIKDSDDKTMAATKIIHYLKTINKDARVGFWIEFAGHLNMALSDGKIDFTEAVILSQLAYNDLKKKK